MKRIIASELMRWKKNKRRKPLLVRGARQVGKTHSVRDMGKTFESFVEVNFELYPDAKRIFHTDLAPSRIARDLSIFTGNRIIPGKTLLFLDEIQQAPKAVSALRYFHEMLPDLHVVAAGSLLDFELENTGLPVGRISSLYMYPLSFLEFLKAKGEDLLIEAIIGHNPNKQINEAIHKKLLSIVGEYLAVGGMPEAVNCWVETSDPRECARVHRAVIETYRQDFNKYASRYQMKYVEILFNAVPSSMGKKFKYNNVPGDYRKRELMPSLDLLVKAGVAHKVVHSSGQGIPLGAEANHDRFKTIFLDIALAQTAMGIDSSSWLLDPETNFVNKGMVTEAFVGQEITACCRPTGKCQLYYWLRESRSSSAEVDYLLQKEGFVIPVEVKSGAPGSLKSLNLFLKEHLRSPYGVRFSTLNFSSRNKIRSYPIYAVPKIMLPNTESFYSPIL